MSSMLKKAALKASAAAFVPTIPHASDDVLDATFVTQAIPDIGSYDGVVGLCTVPDKRAGMDDLGWHVSDFLAFKSLLCRDQPTLAQSWLSMCDIPKLVEQHPERYAHGKERRVVDSAAETRKYRKTWLAEAHEFEREDNIQVEPSVDELKAKFLKAIGDKLAIIKQRKYKLAIIICGPSNLEQDVFFDAPEDYHFPSHRLRETIDPDVPTMVITPAPFSAGWQVNPSFLRSPVQAVRADRTEFLARQLGGLFAKDIVAQFLGWKCPMLDYDQVDSTTRDAGFPGPAIADDSLNGIVDQLKTGIHTQLTGRLTAKHNDHSFSFQAMDDDWTKLIGPRGKEVTLNKRKEQWDSLPIASAADGSTGYAFLGRAFGGNEMSQRSQLKHLLMESFEAWPGYWVSSFGQATKEEFIRALYDESIDAMKCHEVFSAIEHRATTAVLADKVVQYFGLPKPFDVRCRDWSDLEWRHPLTPNEQVQYLRPFGALANGIPSPNVPHGMNYNQLSKIQKRLDWHAMFVSASLHLRHSKEATTEGLEGTVARIHALLREIKSRQIESLVDGSAICDKCCEWLRAMGLPIRAPEISLEDTTSDVWPAAPRNEEGEYGQYVVGR
ncbi:hypothetical protein GGR56DRAFT_674972 [Xylariaceae sp. FL0804]|nr:hypothetical protein GGR56DRAFT_674972 [Xylariaceae sp. FL0804]